MCAALLLARSGRHCSAIPISKRLSMVRWFKCSILGRIALHSVAMSDYVVPVVFPDYLIVVVERPVEVKVPDLIPGVDLFPDYIRIPATRLPDLGHAGVLFIKGATGTTKYYEYGRYDRAKLGLVMRRRIPDVIIKNKLPTQSSLASTLRQISQLAGQNTRISGAFIQLPDGAYDRMLAYAAGRLKDNTNPNRVPYSLTSNSCLHFMKETAEAGGVDMPWVIDPRPDGYIDRVRSTFPGLDYDPKHHALNVPTLEQAAKKTAGQNAAVHGR